MECELYAIHDHMPGPDKKWELRVGGTCQAPTPGYELRIERSSPPIVPDPDRVFLRLVVEEPGSDVAEATRVPQVITKTEVEEFVEEHEGEETTVIVHGAEPTAITIEHPG